MNDAVVVFTERSAEDIIADGGSGIWVLNPQNARRRRFIVCCRKGHPTAAAEEPGAAFLIGRIREIVPTDGMTNARNQQRYFIAMEAYARLSLPGVWQAWRNPVRYASLSELGIRADELEWVPLPEQEVDLTAQRVPISVRKLTVPEAKAGLAATLGVRPEQIEIVIKA